MCLGLVVGFAAVGAVLFGFDQGNWAGAIVKDDFVQAYCINLALGRCDTLQCCLDISTQPEEYNTFLSLGSSLLQLGAACGALVLAPPINVSFGRRAGLFAGGLITIVGVLPQALVQDRYVFLVARFVNGLGVGIVTFTLPVFISEISPAEVRGMLGSVFQLVMVLGTVVASAINLDQGLPYHWPFLLPAFPAAILSMGIFFFPMSPRSVLLQHHRLGSMEQGVEHARRALRQLRASEEAAEAELQALREGMPEFQTESTWRRLWTDRSIRRRVLVASGLQWGQQLTGVNAILSYGPSIFAAAAVPIDPLLAALITSCFNLAGTLVLSFSIDSLGRRVILLLGAASMLVCMSSASVFGVLLEPCTEMLDEKDCGPHASGLGWALFGCVCLYMFSFAVAWGGVPWVYPSEIFPLSVKEKAVSVSVVSQWTANCVVAYGVPLQVKMFRASGTFIFYAICLLLCLIFVYICVPETKGIGLEDMGRVFGEEVMIAAGERMPEGSAGSAACLLHLRRDSASTPNPEQRWLSTTGFLTALQAHRESSPAVLEGITSQWHVSRFAAPTHRVVQMSRSGAVTLH